MKTPKCINIVRAFIKRHKGRRVTVEEVAEKHNLKEGDISQCFHILNLEGKISQGQNPWHYRDKGRCPCCTHGWRRTTYYVYHPEMNNICTVCKVSPVHDTTWGRCKECDEEYRAQYDSIYKSLRRRTW